MYFCYAYSLWIYLSWFPTYLKEARGFTPDEMKIRHAIALGAATIGDSVGGWLSDHLARRTGSLRLARRVVAVTGFVVAAACIVPAALVDNREISVVFTTVALFSLELTVGVSWAVAMDVGPEYAGSVSGVMNMCGNMGGTLASPAVPILVKFFNWQTPFLGASGLCLIGALIFLRIDPNERIFDKPAVSSEPITA